MLRNKSLDAVIVGPDMGEKGFRKNVINAPIGAHTVASYARRQGFNVEVFDPETGEIKK